MHSWVNKWSLTRPRATTSSVAAALMASKARNASDNGLDHNTSILPIFQKLLSERQSGSCQSVRRDMEHDDTRYFYPIYSTSIAKTITEET